MRRIALEGTWSLETRVFLKVVINLGGVRAGIIGECGKLKENGEKQNRDSL